MHFQPAFGHDADDVRLEFKGDGNDFGRVGHFQVQARLDLFAQAPDIAVLDMATVLAQMRRDAVRTGLLAEQRRRNGIGFTMAKAAIPRFADRGNMVNIDT